MEVQDAGLVGGVEAPSHASSSPTGLLRRAAALGAAQASARLERRERHADLGARRRTRPIGQRERWRPARSPRRRCRSARAPGRPTRGGGRRGRSGGPRSGRRRSAAARAGLAAWHIWLQRARPYGGGRNSASNASALCGSTVPTIDSTAIGCTPRRAPLRRRRGPGVLGEVGAAATARRRRSRWSRSKRRPASSIPQPPKPCRRSSSRSIPSSAATNPAMKPGKPPSAMPPASSAAGSAAGRSWRRQSGTPRPYPPRRVASRAAEAEEFADSAGAVRRWRRPSTSSLYVSPRSAFSTSEAGGSKRSP